MSGAAIKLVAQAVGGLGVTKVIGDIVKTNTVATTTAQALLIKAGGFVLASMVAEQAMAHIDRTLDGIASSVHLNVEVKKTDPEK